MEKKKETQYHTHSQIKMENLYLDHYAQIRNMKYKYG